MIAPLPACETEVLKELAHNPELLEDAPQALDAAKKLVGSCEQLLFIAVYRYLRGL